MRELDQAKELLFRLRGKRLSVQERVEEALRLARQMQQVALSHRTEAERDFGEQLHHMMEDPHGKLLTTELLDQAFRSHSLRRIADQMHYLLSLRGLPKYVGGYKRAGLKLFACLPPVISQLAVPLVQWFLRHQTGRVIFPAERASLERYLHRRVTEGVSINVNHLGEAVLGEEEAKRRLQLYLNDLTLPEVECISVKISTLYSQIHLLDWEGALQVLQERFSQLLRAAKEHLFRRFDGVMTPKLVHVDMEEYRDLRLTVELFKRTLDLPEFFTTTAGIALQAYLPDAMSYQIDLTQYAQGRIARGGAPIRMRLVKGANLGMEQVEASLRGWPQAPYYTKADVDSNFKRMVDFACQKNHAEAIHIGVGSHNLFDIAYALIMRAEQEVEEWVTFEMLEGMAEPMRRVVHYLAGHMLLYCPVAYAEEFHNAIAYLVRRLDENTGPENFLRIAFGADPDSAPWRDQERRFAHACLQTVSTAVHRTQDRLAPMLSDNAPPVFANEPDTDFCLPANRLWVDHILERWRQEPMWLAPQMTDAQLEQLLACAKDYVAPPWQERVGWLKKAAECLRLARSELVGVMMANTKKSVQEADAEVSEAIDFALYYAHQMEVMQQMEGIVFHPKGTVLVASPWNFPCSIPAGGICAALVTGNAVLFKPAPEAAWAGKVLVECFWEASIPKEALQFIPCSDEWAEKLLQSPSVESVILTGGTETARHILQIRPGLDLLAETGGKNSLIVTAMADRDLAVRDVVASAFGHAGQKCSACSVLILEKEVFHDPHFRRQLGDATKSLTVGSMWNLGAKVTPLIAPPHGALEHAIYALEPGESWLLKPSQDAQDPCLLSPGIRWGVRPGSLAHKTEFFGPILSVMCAESLEEALWIANDTPYGLTAGIHSLDTREQVYWAERMEAGNLYINRPITGAIVERQPFGGYKASSFGWGAKAGGPNYLIQLVRIEEVASPKEGELGRYEALVQMPLVSHLSSVEREQFVESVKSYSFYWDHFFSKDHDPMHLVGQDNLQRYRPHPDLVVRLHREDALLSVAQLRAAASICGASLELSSPVLHPLEGLVVEEDEAFLARLSKRVKLERTRVRLLRMPSKILVDGLSLLGRWIAPQPVIMHGRIELLRFLREVSISYDYHRYGNLGEHDTSLGR